jgi:hypothetical protein
LILDIARFFRLIDKKRARLRRILPIIGRTSVRPMLPQNVRSIERATMAQAIVALLRQASEIGRATVRSSSFIARPPIMAALSAAFFFAARAAREAGEKISQGWTGGTPRALHCHLLPYHPHRRHHPNERRTFLDRLEPVSHLRQYDQLLRSEACD